MMTDQEAQRMAAIAHKRKQGGDVAGALTLRDYFAAKAMQSLVSAPDWRTGEWKIDIALAAYQMADAMLTARGETK